MEFVPKFLCIEPAPSSAPDCHRCGGPPVLRIVGNLNIKGNAGRPYYKCDSCDLFLVFNDERGNDANNLPCYCGASSKMQVSGPETKIPRRLHFVCRLGTCSFFEAALDIDSNYVCLDASSIEN
jgi:hypothetical protein